MWLSTIIVITHHHQKKGYALVEFESRKEAQDAIKGMDGQELLTQVVQVTWAFGSGPCRRVRAS